MFDVYVTGPQVGPPVSFVAPRFTVAVKLAEEQLAAVVPTAAVKPLLAQ
jgi:hypothetical protein